MAIGSTGRLASSVNADMLMNHLENLLKKDKKIARRAAKKVVEKEKRTGRKDRKAARKATKKMIRKTQKIVKKANDARVTSPANTMHTLSVCKGAAGRTFRLVYLYYTQCSSGKESCGTSQWQFFSERPRRAGQN